MVFAEISSRKRLDHFGHDLVQCIKLSVYSIPDNVVINPEVVVNQHIAHARDRAPGNVGMRFAPSSGNLLDRFANDFQAADAGALQSLIGQKRIFSKICGRKAEKIDFVPNMFKDVNQGH